MSGMRSYFQVSMSIARDLRMVKAMTVSGESALVLWLFALAWSRSELSDGAVPAAMLPVIHPLSSRPVDKVAAALVAAGLWRKGESGDYEIAGFKTWNPSREIVEAKLEKDRRRKPVPVDSARIPDGIQTESTRNPDGKSSESVPVPQGFGSDSKSREERGERREKEDQHTQRGHEPAECALGNLPTTPPVRTSDDPAANAILARLRTHPSLAPIASLRTAEALSAVLLGGKKLDWVLQSVDDLALKASLAAARETPIPFNELSDMAGRYASNARPPKPGNAPTGAKLTPADVEAEQRRRKVQVGATDWSQEADVSVETEVG